MFSSEIYYFSQRQPNREEDFPEQNQENISQKMMITREKIMYGCAETSNAGKEENGRNVYL
ncbi:MAG: hypothetical protein LUG83_05295 [Lachnospiraceae bacterium]|nr:hypothetical protein [Lachnospiraceae bacterium]